ncbi:MAG: hypothetical protein EON93_02040 [Burkholderiales bacterium]|nr:MAG: hypothetical protein EON93_02040 [Burkholderiales bacterium]
MLTDIGSGSIRALFASTAGPLGFGSCTLEFRQSDDFWVSAPANQLLAQSASTKMLDKAAYDFLIARQRASFDTEQHNIQGWSHFCFGSNFYWKR